MLERITHDEILELRINRPPVHALDPALARAIIEAVNGAPSQGMRAIVLSSQPKVFSAGLDVPTLLSLDRPELTQFMNTFFELLRTLGTSEIPILVAVTGHAPAGGAVMSAFCDYRVMAEGNFRIGFNEAEVGLLIPNFIRHAMIRLVGAGMAERMIVEGRMVTAAEALRIGLVNDLVPPDQVIAHAIAHARKLLAQPSRTMLQLRAWMRQDLHAMFDQVDFSPEDMVTHWYTEECQGALKAMLARVAKPKA